MTAQILAHAGQISVWMEQHEALVYETVAALQAGFNGAWGEWHTAKHHHSGKKLMEAICQMAPAQLPIQVRTLPIWEKPPIKSKGESASTMIISWARILNGTATAAASGTGESARSAHFPAYVSTMGKCPGARILSIRTVGSTACRCLPAAQTIASQP